MTGVYGIPDQVGDDGKMMGDCHVTSFLTMTGAYGIPDHVGDDGKVKGRMKGRRTEGGREG